MVIHTILTELTAVANEPPGRHPELLRESVVHRMVAGGRDEAELAHLNPAVRFPPSSKCAVRDGADFILRASTGARGGGGASARTGSQTAVAPSQTETLGALETMPVPA